MAFSGNAVHQLLTNNSKDDFLSASELLLRLANNVLENPNDVKYRRIRVGNPLVQSKLLPVVGGMECLFDMGFVEVIISLFLPVVAIVIMNSVQRNITQEAYNNKTNVEDYTPLLVLSQ